MRLQSTFSLLFAVLGGFAAAVPSPEVSPTLFSPIVESVKISDFSATKAALGSPISVAFTLTTQDGKEMRCIGASKSPTDLLKCPSIYSFLLRRGKTREFNVAMIHTIGKSAVWGQADVETSCDSNEAEDTLCSQQSPLTVNLGQYDWDLGA